MTSNNDALARRVEAVLDMALSTVASLDESFTSVSSLLTEDAAPAEDKHSPDASPADITEPAQNGQPEASSTNERTDEDPKEADQEGLTAEVESKTEETVEGATPEVHMEQDQENAVEESEQDECTTRQSQNPQDTMVSTAEFLTVGGSYAAGWSIGRLNGAI